MGNEDVSSEFVKNKVCLYAYVKVVLPLPAEENNESDTADHRHGAAQRCNGGQGQEVAHWARLHLLQ